MAKLPPFGNSVLTFFRCGLCGTIVIGFSLQVPKSFAFFMAKKKSNRKAPSVRREIEARNFSRPSNFSWNLFHKPGGICLICLFLFGLVVWAYWPALNGQYLFHDDFGEVVINQHINTGLTWSGVVWAISSLGYNEWIPLTWISHMLDFQFFGSNPWGHHLTNVLLHAANSVLLFLFLKRMTGALWRSLIVAELFAFHPLRVESVAWICERKDVLSVFFGFLALLAYAEYSIRSNSNRGKPGLFYGLTFLFFAFSLLSKQTLITFPCVLLLLDYWPLDRWKPGNIRRLLLEKIPFFVVLPIVSKISYLAQLRGGALQEMASLPWDARLENALVSYARYLGKFFFPANLSALYPHPGYWPGGYVFMAGLLVVVLSALAWLIRREAPYFFVGWFWFFGTLVPVIGFVQLYSLAMADRFTYVPCIGLAVLLVWGIYALTKRWRYQASIGWLVSGLLLLICLVLTRYQIGFWRDEMTFLNRAIAVDKDNYVAHCLLGYVISMNSTDSDGAFREFQKSADINPRFFQAQLFLGNGLLERGRLDEAMIHFQNALDINPDDMRAEYGLGVACYQKGKMDEGIRLCQKALDNDPNNPEFLNGLAMMLVQRKQFADAVPLLKRACHLNPNDPNAFNNLGVVSLKAGLFDEAINTFQNALKLVPDSTALQGNLAAAIHAKQQADTPNAPAATPTSPPPSH
jgi:protein O-mannosyl-transferase